MEANVLEPGELELFVQNVEASNIETIGTNSWVEWHQRLQKLNQQAVIEASEMREEQTKEAFISFGKLPILVQEALTIYVWRLKILPQILKMNANPELTFTIYMVLYHEAACVGLLETVMFHDDAIQCISDVSADLVDYSIESVIAMLGLIENGYLVSHETKTGNFEDFNAELQRQRNDLVYDIGMRCLSIVRYLSEDTGSARRLCITHDAPLLLASILQSAPWRKRNLRGQIMIYSGGKWKDLDDKNRDAMIGSEVSVWVTLMKLLTDPGLSSYYKIDEPRRNRLCRLEPLLTDLVLDQVPPLGLFKRALSELAVAGTNSGMWGGGVTPKGPVIIELVPEIKERLLKSIHKRIKTIAKTQMETLFKASDKEELMQLAKKLSEVYASDAVEVASGDSKCANCGDISKKKCSRCKTVYYCGRECQVKDWAKHKDICDQYSSLN